MANMVDMNNQLNNDYMSSSVAVYVALNQLRESVKSIADNPDVDKKFWNNAYTKLSSAITNFSETLNQILPEKVKVYQHEYDK